MQQELKRHAKKLLQRPPKLPLTGWPPASRSSALLDGLDDGDLERINHLLPWQCFTVDGRGRRLGKAAWAGKRVQPQAIPDPRIERLDELIGLSGRHVLEVGCFEGVHTIALADRAARVTALDARVDNVVKTAVRCSLYGVHVDVDVCDLEKEPPGSERLACDVVHHAGVLYHLLDPVTHLKTLLAGVRHGLMLDTHYARDDEVDATYRAAGRDWQVRDFREGGRQDVFSGMYDVARWLRLSDLRLIVEEAGFEVLVEEPRNERNGARLLLVAVRT